MGCLVGLKFGCSAPVSRMLLQTVEAIRAAEFETTATSIVRPLKLDALFGRCAPLEVDVGSGHGTFLIEMARRFPERNFLGIEKLARRVRKTIRFAENLTLANVRLLCVESTYAV